MVTGPPAIGKIALGTIESSAGEEGAMSAQVPVSKALEL
jgi:hypothetical protein